MKRLFAILGLAFTGLVRADGFVVVVTEDTYEAIPGVSISERMKKVSITTPLFVTGAKPQVVVYRGKLGARIPEMSRYEVKNDGALWCGSKKICDGGGLLAQCRIGDSDVIILRRSHNTFTSPFKLIRAIAGHPAYICEIYAMRIKDDAVIWSTRLIAKEAAWNFRAELYEEEPNLTPAFLTPPPAAP